MWQSRKYVRSDRMVRVVGWHGTEDEHGRRIVIYCLITRGIRRHAHEMCFQDHCDDLVQNCSNISVVAMELMQFCIKPSILTH